MKDWNKNQYKKYEAINQEVQPMERPTAEELEAYINGFYDAMDMLKQQETATINNTQNLINQL